MASHANKELDRKLDKLFKDWDGYPLTRREIAEKIGCTHQYIGYVEQQGLLKIRRKLGLVK